MKEHIKHLRETLGLSQQEFANRVGMRQSTYAKYETGRSNPSAAAISAICRTFNVNEAWLRTGEGDMFTEDVRKLRVQQAVDEVFGDQGDEFKRRWYELTVDFTQEQWEWLRSLAQSLLNDTMSNEAQELVQIIDSEETEAQE